MNAVNNLIILLIIAAWMFFLSTFSIQNITEVSVKFFWLESIEVPIGVMLSFFSASGLIFGSFFSFLTTEKPRIPPQRKRQEFKRELEPEEDPLSGW